MTATAPITPARRDFELAAMRHLLEMSRCVFNDPRWEGLSPLAIATSYADEMEMLKARAKTARDAAPAA
ncbi:hypothetical protein [Microbacterium testaceum]|uniref:Uncharacterized protein n=1 Tax=Microbacterium testaceum TaxID=2033 RepID=A0A2T7VN23_MICTE|nr:hypothetical protein [Microbacterium testaceum]PVE58793.1 hypothetical protein DC432_15665 [Microbacterium testaceum]